MAKKKSYGKTLGGKEVPQPQPMRTGGTPKRNHPCPCGSKKKYKDCHGKTPARIQSEGIAKTVNLSHFYTPEQREAEKKYRRQYGFAPNPTQLAVYMDGDEDEIKRILCEALERAHAPEYFKEAVRKLNMLITPLNRDLLTDEEKQKYTEFLEEYRREHEPARPVETST